MHFNEIQHTTNPTPPDSVIQALAVPGLSHVITLRGNWLKCQMKTDIRRRSNNKVRGTHRGKSATYLIAEYHQGSASKYSPWELMHRCQRLVHHSKQFWNWFCGMAFRAAVVLLLMSSMSSKCLPFNISFIFRNRKKSLGARSGE